MTFPAKQIMTAALALGISAAAGHASALVVNGSAGPMTVSNDLGPIAVSSPTGELLLPGGQSNLLSPFQINLNYTAGAPGGSTQAAFESAKATWESIITGWQEDAGLSAITIDVNLGFIDGPGGTLGSAGPTGGNVTANFLYASTGSMTFDTSDIGTTLTAAEFENVVEHEMAHVLGIGTLWSASGATGGGVVGRQELYINNSGQYTGAAGLAAYNSEFSQAGAFVPVELAGGAGTANGHWNEVDFGAGLTGITSNIQPGPNNDMAFELMGGWLNAPTFISTLTRDSFIDLGYDVVPEPSSLALLVLGGLLVARRRRG